MICPNPKPHASWNQSHLDVEIWRARLVQTQIQRTMLGLGLVDEDCGSFLKCKIPFARQFQCKHHPTGEVVKSKAQICLRGDLTVNDSDTLALVATWSAVCFFLGLMAHVRCVVVSVGNWINSFPQQAALAKPFLTQEESTGFLNK